MDPVLADLLSLLRLERLELNLFRGESRHIGSAQVYGGQVLGQALAAASQTIEGRDVHSLHAYFLRRGDFEAPIIYHVDRQRDGGSFSNRRVVAIQHGQPILNLACSFQTPEQGIEHQLEMPSTPLPEDLTDIRDLPESPHPLPEKMRRFLFFERPFEFRPIESPDYAITEPTPPRKHVWFRAVDQMPHDPALSASLLAYVSDYGFMTTAIRPHGLSSVDHNLILASLDHAMWFHRPADLGDWMLYAMDAPTTVGGRGLARGSIFARDGRLIATTTQEGLIRKRDDRRKN